jgi:hypothetical protein
MVSLRVLLESQRPRDRRQPVDFAPVVLPPRQAVVDVVAYLAYEVRMRLIDADHGALLAIGGSPIRCRPMAHFYGFRTTRADGSSDRQDESLGLRQ